MPRRVPDRRPSEDDERRATQKAFVASLKGEGRRRAPRSEPEPSPLIDERKESEPELLPEYETGTVCPECGGRQYNCPSGVVCAEGHGVGEASGIPVPECEPESRRSPPTVADQFAESIVAMGPRLAPGMQAIVDRVFDVRPEEVYARLERELRLHGRESKADRATVEAALDASQDNAREAHRLYAHARVEQEAFELDARATLADMRGQAIAALEQDRTAKAKAGERAKQITEADVEDWIAAHFHDEHRAMQLARKRLDKTIEHLERLAELWRSRPRTLEALFTASRV